MMKAIRIHETGSADVLRYEEVADPIAKPGEIVMRISATGVNFVDTYYRSGLYKTALPASMGGEAAGSVEAIGEGVSGFTIGDRIGYAMAPLGSYAEKIALPADRVVHIPENVSFEIAAASMLKGWTARYLLRKTFPVEPGHNIVIHAAAGGVGQIAVQWARHLGANIIAVVGNDEKANIATTLGAHHTIISTREDIAKRVKELTNGEGADVVFDSVGKDTYEATLNSLKPLGMFVSFGNASGPLPPINAQILSAKGSLFFTRPGLLAYIRTPQMLRETADDLFDVIGRGIVKIAQPTIYKLENAAQAHRDLEGRKTTGSLVLTP
ncbi:MAG: quinone oxidoreductase [Caulobacterales bacterium]